MSSIPGNEVLRESAPLQHYARHARNRAESKRSRSPSRLRHGQGVTPSQQYRERSRSRSRPERTGRREDYIRKSQTPPFRTAAGYHRDNRNHLDDGSTGSKEPTRGRGTADCGRAFKPRGRDHNTRHHSPGARNLDPPDHIDSHGRSGSRHSSTHNCTDASLQGHDVDGSLTVMKPTPTPLGSSHNIPSLLLTPSETVAHRYASHRCHHPDHHASPIRSSRPTSPIDQAASLQRRASPSPPLLKPPVDINLVALPHGAQPLSRWDFAAFEPLFAHYVEKRQHHGGDCGGGRRLMADLDERGVRDRWKGFVSRWNAGALDECWYDPEMVLRVIRARARDEAAAKTKASGPAVGDGGPIPSLTSGSLGRTTGRSAAASGDAVVRKVRGEEDDADGDDDDGDAFPTSGPSPPSITSTKQQPLMIPPPDDLARHHALEAASSATRHHSHSVSRTSSLADQQARLEEIIPRTGAVPRVWRVAARSSRVFASAREATGSQMAVDVRELLRGTGNGAAEYARVLAALKMRRMGRDVTTMEEGSLFAELVVQRSG